MVLIDFTRIYVDILDTSDCCTLRKLAKVTIITISRVRKVEMKSA